MRKIRDCAKTLRSKNCDPFYTTFDIFFDKELDYLKLKKSNVLNKKDISKLYGILENQITGIYYLDNILAIKITLIKTIPSSEPDCKDVFGAHQHIMLANVKF